MGQFVLRKASDSQFYFRLHANNGETILTGETYTSKASALKGLESVQANAPLDSRYERKKAANGQHMFNLKGANGERIGTSETYVTETGRENGIASVKATAPTAIVNDQT